MAQHNILGEEESKNVFDHLGGNRGKDKSCLSFKEFSEQVRPGMGTQGEDQYPNFLRPKKVGEFRGAERFTKSHYFDPKSVADTSIFVVIQINGRPGSMGHLIINIVLLVRMGRGFGAGRGISMPRWSSRNRRR